MLISGVLATCAVLIVALFLWQRERTRANELTVATDTLRKMLDESRLEEAQAFAEQIANTKPQVADQAQFTSLVGELTGKATTEKDRAQALLVTSPKQTMRIRPRSMSLQSIARRRSHVPMRTNQRSFVYERDGKQWEQEAERQDFAKLRVDLEPIKLAVESIQKQPIADLNESDLRSLLKQLTDLNRNTSLQVRAVESWSIRIKLNRRACSTQLRN